MQSDYTLKLRAATERDVLPMSPSSVRGLYHCIREMAITRTQSCWRYGHRSILMAHPQTRGDTALVHIARMATALRDTRTVRPVRERRTGRVLQFRDSFRIALRRERAVGRSGGLHDHRLLKIHNATSSIAPPAYQQRCQFRASPATWDW